GSQGIIQAVLISHLHNIRCPNPLVRCMILALAFYIIYGLLGQSIVCPAPEFPFDQIPRTAYHNTWANGLSVGDIRTKAVIPLGGYDDSVVEQATAPPSSGERITAEMSVGFGDIPHTKRSWFNNTTIALR